MCAGHHHDGHAGSMGLVESESGTLYHFKDVSSGFGRAVGNFVTGEDLSNERLGQLRSWLVRRSQFSRGGGGRGSLQAKGEERFARHSIKYESIAHLGDLSDGIYLATIAGDGDEVGGAWDVEVPYVVSYFLEVPDSLALYCVDGDHAIGEQVETVVSMPEEIGFG